MTQQASDTGKREPDPPTPYVIALACHKSGRRDAAHEALNGPRPPED